jgi:hypothetical protein
LGCIYVNAKGDVHYVPQHAIYFEIEGKEKLLVPKINNMLKQIG